MKTEEITGAENVFRALLDGRVLTGAGGLTMLLKDGLLIVSDVPRVLHLDLDNMQFTYPRAGIKGRRQIQDPPRRVRFNIKTTKKI